MVEGHPAPEAVPSSGHKSSFTGQKLPVVELYCVLLVTATLALDAVTALLYCLLLLAAGRLRKWTSDAQESVAAPAASGKLI